MPADRILHGVCLGAHLSASPFLLLLTPILSLFFSSEIPSCMCVRVVFKGYQFWFCVSSPKSSTPPIQVRKEMETYRQAPRQSHEKTGRVKSEVDHTPKEGRHAHQANIPDYGISISWTKKIWARYRHVGDAITYPAPMGSPQTVFLAAGSTRQSSPHTASTATEPYAQGG